MRTPLLFDDLYAESDWRPPQPPSLDGIHEVELDVETDGLKWHSGNRPIGIGIRTPDNVTRYLPWGHAGGNLDENVVRRWAQTELKGKRITNLSTKFDIHMLRVWGVDLEAMGCEVSDVAHYAALLDDSRRKFSLDALSKDILGKEKIGKELNASRMKDYHAAQVAPRAEGDVQLVGELKAAMWPELTKQGLQKVRQLEDDVIFPVCEMEKNGAYINVEKLHRWYHKSEAEVNAMFLALAKEAGFQCNPKRAADMVRLFQKCGVPIRVFTDKGAPSFASEVLEAIPHPTIQLAKRILKLLSLRSKFIVPYYHAVGADGILRFNLHQLKEDEHGTISGRFSSSDKNIQQVMTAKKQMESFGEDFEYIIRELFEADPNIDREDYDEGKLEFLAADAEQIEYRLFAHYANSKKINEAYEKDPWTNFHKLVQAIIAEFKPDITYKRAKDTNFAKVYSAGKDKIAAMLNLPRHESDKLVMLYDLQFPEIPKLNRYASNLLKTRGYVKTLEGRRSRDVNRLHKALNAVIQGGAADINKRKVVELHKARKYTGLLLRMTVHDEAAGDKRRRETKERVKEVLNAQSYPLRVPILWDVATGKNWKECKAA